MSNSSNISIGLMHEVTKTACKAGFESSDFTTMAQSEAKLRKILGYLRGEADIVLRTVDKAAEVIIQKVTNLLRLVKSVAVSATDEKELNQSFPIGPRYYHCDADIKRWLSARQRAGAAGRLNVWQLESEMDFREIGLAILGLEDGDVDTVTKGLIAGNHTVVPSQIETLIERTEADEDVGLNPDVGNFFFVEDKDGGVSVVLVLRDDSQWRVRVDRLGNDIRWVVGYRFFSRN